MDSVVIRAGETDLPTVAITDPLMVVALPAEPCAEHLSASVPAGALLGSGVNSDSHASLGSVAPQSSQSHQNGCLCYIDDIIDAKSTQSRIESLFEGCEVDDTIALDPQFEKGIGIAPLYDTMVAMPVSTSEITKNGATKVSFADEDDSVDADVDPSISACKPQKSTSCQSHRSMLLLIELDVEHAKGRYLQVDETNDTGAGLNYTVLELAEVYKAKCPGAIVEMKRYDKPRVTVAADKGQIIRAGWMKLRVIVRNDQGEDVERVRRLEILSDCILQMILGIKTQSEERGCLDIHAKEMTEGATATDERYWVRYEADNQFPVYRQTNNVAFSF